MAGDEIRDLQDRHSGTVACPPAVATEPGTSAGLVDELHLMVGSAVLGGATPAFGAGPVPPLRLVNTQRRDGSDNLLLQYKVVSTSGSR
jgi:hypothetical protein